MNNTVNKKNMTPGGCLPLFRDYMHVYNHYYQTSSLKPLGQSNPTKTTDFLVTRHIYDSYIFLLQLADDGESLKDEDPSVTERRNTDSCPKTEGFVKESITCLQSVQLKMLQMTKYTETVLGKLPGIKVEIDLEKNEIRFEGDANLILSGYRNLVKTISKFGLNRIENNLEKHIGLYEKETVIEYIDNKLEAQNLACTWEVNEQTLVVCSLEESIAECTKLVGESVTERKFPISKQSSATLITQEWEEEVKQIHDKNEFVFNVFSDKTSTIITVIATDKEISDIVSRIKDFLKSQLKMVRLHFCGHEQLPGNFKQWYDLNSTVAHRVLEHIEEGLSLYHVRISKSLSWSLRIYMYDIDATREGVDLATKRIAQLDIEF